METTIPYFEAMDVQDTIPPDVVIEPSGGTFADSLLDVTVWWCDDKNLEASTRTIKHGRFTVTSSFSWEYVGTFAEPCNVFGVAYKSEGTIDLSVSGSLSASIRDDDFGNLGSDQANYDYEPEIPPTVWTTPMNEGYRNTALEAADGFEMVVTHTTPGYVLKDRQRSLTFVYRSGQVDPRALVQVKVSSGGANPDKFSMKVKDPMGADMTFVNTDSTELFWDGTQSTVMLGGVVDASGLGTGAHDLAVLVRSHFGGSFEETPKTVRVLVVDESASPFGEGWSIAGIQHAYTQADGSVLITEGDGSAIYFEENGSSFDTPNGDFSTLSSITSPYSGYQRTYPNGSWVRFNSSGQMLDSGDRFGNHIDYTYNGPGGAFSSMNVPATGEIHTTLTYTDSTITVREGKHNGYPPEHFRETVIHLNGSGRVTSIEGPDGNEELGFSYAAGRIDQVTDRRGNTTDYAYDGLGYLASSELPQIEVDEQNVRPEIEQQSLAMTLGPDPASGDGTSGNPATAVTASNVKPWIEDARDARTYFTLDPFGAPLRIEEPLGRTTIMTRNTHSQVTRVDRPSGAYSTTNWSGPRVTSTFESTTGHTVSYGYASPPESNHHQPVRIYDNKGNRETWYEYDSDDQVSAVYYDSIGGPQIGAYTYRPDGRPLIRTDAGGHVTKFDYGFVQHYFNLLTMDVHGTGDSLRTTHAYDDYGRRVKTINPAGDSTFMAYDDLDRVLWSANALGDTTYFDFDGYLVKEVKDAEGQLHRSAFNALGWATASIDPNGDTTHVGYDENGNVISVVDRLGHEASFGYDSLNLPTFEQVEGVTTHLWTGPDGLESAAWNAFSADTTVFDSAGRPIKQIVRRGTNLSRRYVIESAYDDDGPRNRLWVSAPGSIDYDMRYVWNDEGRLERLTDHVPATPIHTDFVYNAHKQLDHVKVGGTKRWEYDYSSFHPLADVEYPVSALDDAFGYGVNLDPDLLRISEWNWADGDTVRTIDYDAAGQVTAIVDSAFIGHTCEWYDNYGELCYGGYPEGEVDQASFAYDSVGNRKDSGAVTDTGNRLTDLGAFSFTHDGEGRTLTKSASGFLQTYHWNDRSQLDSVTTIDAGDTTVVRYTYDGLGRRITRDGPGGFEEYLYDGPHVIAILDDQQAVVSTLSYYPGVDRPHSLMTSSETYYYATDPTGSVSGLAEFTGAASVTHRYRYDVWGKPQGNVTEAVPNPIRFKARWWDEDTGLADFRARWYDPDIGRFISEDPIGLAGGINVYRFVGNDPVSGWDPFGMFDTDCPDGVYEGATCTLDPLTVDGGPGDFNPSGAFEYFGSNGAPIPLGNGQSTGKGGYRGGVSSSRGPEQAEACSAARLNFALTLGSDIVTGVSLVVGGIFVAKAAVEGARAAKALSHAKSALGMPAKWRADYASRGARHATLAGEAANAARARAAGAVTLRSEAVGAGIAIGGYATTGEGPWDGILGTAKNFALDIAPGVGSVRSYRAMKQTCDG